MLLSCDNCELVLAKYLCDMPDIWRKAIVKVICKSLYDATLDCEDIKECQTLTSLSAFTQTKDQICVEFKNERGEISKRCFVFPGIMDTALQDVDPWCIASAEEWVLMTYAEKVQAIIDYRCECC